MSLVSSAGTTLFLIGFLWLKSLFSPFCVQAGVDSCLRSESGSPPPALLRAACVTRGPLTAAGCLSLLRLTAGLPLPWHSCPSSPPRLLTASGSPCGGGPMGGPLAALVLCPGPRGPHGSGDAAGSQGDVWSRSPGCSAVWSPWALCLTVREASQTWR